MLIFEKQTLHREAFENMRQEFFATIDTIEIEKQLLGFHVGEGLKKDIQFVFERAWLAGDRESTTVRR